MGAGCASAPPEGPHPVWPPPPATPRIAHVKNVRRARDLRAPGLLERLISAVAGSPPQSLLRPQAVAFDAEGRMYVADLGRQLVHVFDMQSGDAWVIDRAGETFLVSPVGVAAYGGEVAVSDSALGEVYIFTPEGELLRKLRKPDGFARPTGLAYDRRSGRLYVVDTLAGEVCVFGTDGAFLRPLGAPGSDVGRFSAPTYAFVDPEGRLYVTDSLNFRVQVFDSQGRYLLQIGQLGDASGYLAVPKGVVTDAAGHIYIVDSYFSVVQVYDKEGRFLLDFGGPGNQNGAFRVPTGLGVGPEGRLYVCDSYNKRLQVFEYVGEADEGSTERSESKGE
jgi:DNA-binding beta-propeller fold protein YncE